MRVLTRMLLVLVIGALPITAGAQSQVTGGNKVEVPGAEPKLPQNIDTVTVDKLPGLINEFVAVEGLIGNYKRDPAKSTFVYSIKDAYGGVVRVRSAEEPPLGGTRYRISGYVQKDPSDGQLYINESRRTPLSGSNKPAPETPPPSEKKDLPLTTIIGLALIAVAVISGIGLILHTRQQTQRRLLLAEQQRRQAEQERERQAAEARARQQPSSSEPPTARGGTVAVGGSPKASSPQRTVEAWGQVKITAGPHAGTFAPLTGKQIVIGRDGGDIQLPQDSTVSSKHGEIVATNDGRLLYVDTSLNGSRVDGKPVHRTQVEIKPNSVIEVGASKLELVINNIPGMIGVSAKPAPAAETIVSDRPGGSAASAPTSQFMGVELAVVEGVDKGQHYPVGKPSITIGRQDNQDFRLTDDHVSRVHATLALEEGSWVLRNVSQRGTQVNGASIDSIALKHGDRLLLGGTVMEFHSIK